MRSPSSSGLKFTQFSILRIHNAFDLPTLVQMVSSNFDQVCPIILVCYGLVYRATLVAVGTFVVHTLVTSLLLRCIAVVFPQVVVEMRMFFRFDDHGDCLHLTALSLPLLGGLSRIGGR